MGKKSRLKTHNDDEKYKVISLFSGAMGLDIGLEKTGRFQILACVEKEHAFAETIRLNHRKGRLHADLKIFEKDINELNPLDILSEIGLKPGELDLLVGGPPCQSFSTAGKRRTVQEPRGTLLWQYLRFVEKIQPKFFLMENVRGVLSAALRHRPIAKRCDKGGSPLEPDEQPGSVIRLFAENLQKLEGVSYHMDCFEVNAVNYGAPQLRERALFIGNRYNVQVDFPNPTHRRKLDPKNKARLDSEERSLLPWGTLRDAIGDLYESDPIIMDFSPRKKKYLSMVSPGSNWRSLPVEIQKESMASAWVATGGRSGWWRRLSFDLPCPTLVTMPNHAGTSLCHPSEVRALTLREYARIQEFPDDWEFFGTASEQYTQVGNAMPVRLGRIAGDAISSTMDSIRERNWKRGRKKLDDYRIVYIQSHVRTRQWFKEGETRIWNDGKFNGNARSCPPKTKRKYRPLIQNIDSRGGI